jgi:uncharacterized protein with FMN-binding domain
MMPEEQKKSNAGLWSVVGVLIVAVLGYGVFNYTKKDPSVESADTTVPPLTTDENPSVPSTPTVTTMYKDGTYTAEGVYTSPAGSEKINVTLFLKDDVIVDATVKALATVPASVNWQGKFISGVKAEVVGKKLSEVTLTKVSGSSLTPKGWNDAVAKIQTQAKA